MSNPNDLENTPVHSDGEQSQSGSFVPVAEENGAYPADTTSQMPPASDHYGQQFMYQQPAVQKTSVLAIVALILAFFVPPVGLIIGIIALVKLKSSGEKGRGLAISSIVVSVISMILSIVMIVMMLKVFSQLQQGIEANPHVFMNEQSALRSDDDTEKLLGDAARVWQEDPEESAHMNVNEWLETAEGHLFVDGVKQGAGENADKVTISAVGDSTLRIDFINPDLVADEMPESARAELKENLNHLADSIDLTEIPRIKDAKIQVRMLDDSGNVIASSGE
ncbi:DUF4190 domain-containing protein [Schaalia sp. lx-100]|uniref:DUF4190 domain-containing protein n=1 Tax=Schaalia sp. lx-100 TaxID=2899081 RepID=UPI001E363711|nr:DUF4190 domain-containing protein [Schaalia sp. lx-100]MCD4557737.1 DUF4190 domain-containing protein [Schaalia sp. lx-100]